MTKNKPRNWLKDAVWEADTHPQPRHIDAYFGFSEPNGIQTSLVCLYMGHGDCAMKGCGCKCHYLLKGD